MKHDLTTRTWQDDTGCPVLSWLLLLMIDAMIERMVGDGYTYTEIASEMGNGLKHEDFNKRWNKHVKKSSGIIKPPVQVGPKSSITWTWMMIQRL